MFGQELGRLGLTLEGGWNFPEMTNHLNPPGLSKITEVPEIEGKSASHYCNFHLDLHSGPVVIQEMAAPRAESCLCRKGSCLEATGEPRPTFSWPAPTPRSVRAGLHPARLPWAGQLRSTCLERPRAVWGLCMPGFTPATMLQSPSSLLEDWNSLLDDLPDPSLFPSLCCVPAAR